MSAPDETAVLSAVFSFLRERPERTILVAFSGGPDSTVLLWALTRAAERVDGEPPRIVAAHLDHRLDSESGARAEVAVGLARRLGLADADLRVDQLSPPSTDDAADGVEDWARRRRYDWLQRVAREEAADVVVTAHHADDQAETVVLRLLFGSGLRGLAGVRPERDLGEGVRLVRPLLQVRRREIDTALLVARRELPDLTPSQDPTNADVDQPRAFVRGHLLPRLEAESPGATEAMIRVAEASRGFRRRVDDLLDEVLATPAPEPEPYDFLQPPRRKISFETFCALPHELRSHALARLHADLGEPLPPPQSAVSELERQLDVMKMTSKGARPGTAGFQPAMDGYKTQGGRQDAGAPRGTPQFDGASVGVDCGGGLRWSVRRAPDGSQLLQLEHRIASRPFTYTFDAPGTTTVPEIFVSLHVGPSSTHRVEPWMLRGEVLRTALSLPRGTRPIATVRNRRPGDRLQPLGATGRRKLKDLLIDRRVPRSVRDRLPLLLLDGILAWVPGVTVEERFRLPSKGSDDRREIWIAEIRLEDTD